MQNEYETPELTLIGKVDEVVMGFSTGGDDAPRYFGADFEFEPDE